MSIHASAEAHTYSRAHTLGIMWSDRGFYSNGHVLGHWVTRRAAILSQGKQGRPSSALAFSLLLFSLSHHLFPPPSLFALHLSSHSTSSAPLNQHPHFSCFLIPLLLHIPSYFHLFVSLSKDSVNQIESRGETFALQEDGWALAPAVGMSWGLRTGYMNTHTHTHRPSSISIPFSFLCICHFDSLPGCILLYQQ